MEAQNKKNAKRIIIALLVGFLSGVLASLFVIYFVTPYKSSNPESTYSPVQVGPKPPSVIWVYNIEPLKKRHFDIPFDKLIEGVAYFDLDLANVEDNFDLLDYRGISFYIRGKNSEDIEFNLFTHVFYNGTHDLYQYQKIISVKHSLKKETIYFSDLTRAPWTYSKAPEKPDLKIVYAIGFAAKTNENRIRNAILIDEVELIYKNDSKVTISDFSTFNANINGKEGYWHAWWEHH